MGFIALRLSKDVHVRYGTPALIGSGKKHPSTDSLPSDTRTQTKRICDTHFLHVLPRFFPPGAVWRRGEVLGKEARRQAEADSVQQHGVKIYLAAGKMTPLSLWLQDPHNNMLKTA